MAEHELPPVPFQYIAQQETYLLAVRLYLDSVAKRATDAAAVEGLDKPSVRHVMRILYDDSHGLKEAKDRGEIV